MTPLTALFLGGAMLGGSFLTSRANQQAAQLAYQAQMQQAEAIRAGNEMADQRLREQEATQAARSAEFQQAMQPSTDYLQKVVATDPRQLTPAQQQQVADARRESIARWNNSGFRGARGLSEYVSNVEEGVVGQIMDSNRARSDAASQSLMNMYAGQMSGADARAAGVGNQLAVLPATTGAQLGQIYANTGTNNANMVMANAQNTASTLGELAGLMHTADKEARVNRYLDGFLAKKEDKDFGKQGE